MSWNRLLFSVGLSALCGMSAPAWAVGPSFDCAKASTNIEITICDSALLSRLDQEMASLYRYARGQLGLDGRARLLSDQRAWMTRRNACGANERCLAVAIAERSEAIRAFMTGRPPDPITDPMGPGPVFDYMAGHWNQLSDTASRDGLTLSAGLADFGAGGRYAIEPLRVGGRIFRITGRSAGAWQLTCGEMPARFVSFMRTGDRLEVQVFAGDELPGEPDPSSPMKPLPGACGMVFYSR